MTICACIFPLFCVLFHLTELEKLRPVPNYSFPCIFSCSGPGLTHTISTHENRVKTFSGDNSISLIKTTGKNTTGIDALVALGPEK